MNAQPIVTEMRDMEFRLQCTVSGITQIVPETVDFKLDALARYNNPMHTIAVPILFTRPQTTLTYRLALFPQNSFQLYYKLIRGKPRKKCSGRNSQGLKHR